MQNIFFIIFIAIGLTACGGKQTTTTTATVPTYTTPPLPTVYLKASNMGNISQIDLQVMLPTGTDNNLLDYNGQADITGTLQSSLYPCMKSSQYFNCKAQLSVGNIAVQNCSIGNHQISMLISVFRGQNTQEAYSIISIQSEVSYSCYIQQTQ